MSRLAGVPIFALLALLLTTPPAGAQTAATDVTALRDAVARRFEILPLRDGVVLRPRNNPRVRSIEIARGPVAIDGQPATGSELRDKLGEDADLVLRVSYLSDADRRRLLDTVTAGSQNVPSTSQPSTPDSPPPPPRVADAPPPPDEPTPEPRRRARRSSDNDRVHVGGSVTVRMGEVVEGDVVAIGGSANVDGEVRGDVVAVGGSVRLGPNANVSNNVVVVGGALQRDPAARVDGQVQQIGLGIDFSRLPWADGSWRASWGSMFGSTFVLFGTLTRGAILSLLAALVILLGRGYAERAGTQAAINPLKAGIIGLLAQLLFLPVLVITIVVLCITIIGIPLLALIPFALLGLMLVGLIGFTGVAQRVGSFVSEHLGWSRDSYYATTIVGIVALLLPLLLARVLGLVAGGFLFPVSLLLGIAGFVLEYVAWTVGFGAVALLRFQPSSTTPVVSSDGALPAGTI